ncbi:MAG TPA: TolC family protein [Bryobacteraceae bacterium]|jgi:outer membrane protein TolC|nr:TolC family protein [Bryobacteraceae bacterium]
MQRIKLAIGLVAVAPLFAQLQSRPQVLQLSLKQAVEMALAPEGSTRVKLAEETLKQGEARRLEARAALLPDLEGYLQDQSETNNLKAYGFKFPTTPIAGVSIPTFVGPFTVLDARATVNQSVFDFSSIRRYQASKVAVEAIKADNEGTRDQVTDQVARAYLTGLRAEAALETAKADVELSEALVKLAQSQKAAGTGTGIEITRAEVQLANDNQRRLVAENDVERAHLQLLKVIGLKLENRIELMGKLEYVPVQNVDPAQALVTARENRAELKAQGQREENAKLNFSATKLERLPTLGAFANYGDVGSSITSAVPTRAVGVTLRVPIFDGGRRDARRVESASAYRQEKIRTADLHDQIELDVRLALDGLRSADSQVKAAEEGLMLSENELAQAQRRYKAGVTNSIEVTDAQTRLDRARDNRISALYNYNVARIDLGTATGTIQSMIQ